LVAVYLVADGKASVVHVQRLFVPLLMIVRARKAYYHRFDYIFVSLSDIRSDMVRARR
jgi:hypothetical protein